MTAANSPAIKSNQPWVAIVEPTTRATVPATSNLDVNGSFLSDTILTVARRIL
jgi:hypothetical protein